jgi:hypothetical protein
MTTKKISKLRSEGHPEDLGFFDYEPYISEYKEFILSMLSIYTQNQVPEDNPKKTLHNALVYGSVRNAIFTILSETIKTFCINVRPKMVSFDDSSATEFYSKFIGDIPNKDEYIVFLAELTKIVTTELTHN